MRRCFLRNILTAFYFGGACLKGFAAPINCKAASIDVDQAICGSPKLLLQDKKISDRLNSLKSLCPNSTKALVEGQKFWLRDRWDCRNSGVTFDKPADLNECLAERMDERLQQLNETGKGCDFASLIATYRYVDVDYLARFSANYIGKKVAVFGWLDPANCDTPPTMMTWGEVVGKKNGSSARFRLKFAAMPAARHRNICEENPAAHWQGTVKHDNQGDYLYLTDFLGVPLSISEKTL